MLKYALGAVLVVAGVFTWIALRAPVETAMPPAPTEKGPRLSKDQKQARLDWYESLHRAPDGVDWRAVERGNRADLLARRNLAAKNGVTDGKRYWREIGSANNAGRTWAAHFSQQDNAYYVGTDGGGLWRAFADSGPTYEHLYWEPLSDGIGGGAFHVVQMDDGTLAMTNHNGVTTSRDGGVTWVQAAGFSSSVLGERGRLMRALEGGATLFYLVDEFRFNSVRTGLYRSTDNGQNFTRVRNFTVHGDIWCDRVNYGTLYAVDQGVLQQSQDGMVWEEVGRLPTGFNRRCMLAGSEAGAPKFYVAVDLDDYWRLYSSEDGGKTWERQSDFDDAWYGLHSFEAAVTNPDVLLVGNIEMLRSDDGGTTLESVQPWWWYDSNPSIYLHADLTGFNFQLLEDGREILFINTDGGTYLSDDLGANWRNIVRYGMNISQYYDTFTDPDDPNYIQVGAQDQGYQAGYVDAGLSHIQIQTTGDYAHLNATDPSGDIVYSVYPGFVLVTVRDGEELRRLGWPQANIDFPNDIDMLWLPEIVADPENPWRAWLAGTSIWELNITAEQQPDGEFSYDWTWTQHPQTFGNVLGGLTIAPSDPNRWYASTVNGRIWRSDDRGGTWTEASSGATGHYFHGNDIWVHPTNPDHVVVSGSGYDNPPAVVALDGLNFTQLGQNPPATLILELVHDPSLNGDFYAATEAGPWRYNAATDDWQSLVGVEAPMTTYWSVEIVADYLRFGTFGRGIWDFHPKGVVETSPRWIPHITPVGGNFETTLSITDTTGAGGSVFLQPYDVSGNPLTGKSLKINDGYQRRTSAELFGDLPVSHVRISGPDHLMATAAYRASGAAAGGVAHVNQQTQPGRRFQLFTGEWDTIWDGMALVNLSDQPARVEGVRLNADGSEAARHVIFEALEPNSKGLLNFASVFDAADGAVVIESNQDALVTFLRGSLGSGTSYLYQTEAVRDQPQQDLRWLPHVTRYVPDTGFRTRVMGVAGEGQGGDLTLQPYDFEGNRLTTRQLDVPAGGYVDMAAEDLFDGEPVAHFSVEGPATVTLGYRVAPGRSGGTAHVNETTLASQRFTIYQSGWDQTWDGLAVMNTSDAATAIQVVRYDGAGRELSRVTLESGLPPKAKSLLDFRTITEDDADALVVLESTLPVSAVFLRGPAAATTSYLYQTVPITAPQ